MNTTNQKLEEILKKTLLINKKFDKLIFALEMVKKEINLPSVPVGFKYKNKNKKAL